MNKKLIAYIAAFVLGFSLTGLGFSLTGCSTDNTYSSDSNMFPSTNRATTYTVVTDWAIINGDHESAIDKLIRIVKIENVCYLQTESIYDSGYVFVPTGQSC